jgi:hypothetical protein
MVIETENVEVAGSEGVPAAASASGKQKRTNETAVVAIGLIFSSLKMISEGNSGPNERTQYLQGGVL